MSRRFTLDEYLKEFADEEGISVPDAISLHVSDAEVHSLGLFFIRFMGGVLHCLRTPPKKRRQRRSSKVTKEHESSRDPIEDLAVEPAHKDLISTSEKVL